jgi:hypothetical protein
MAIKFTGENAPIVLFDMINRGAKPKLVHEMGRSIEKDYDYEKAIALEKFMRDKKWSNGQATIAMITVLALGVADLDGDAAGVRESLTVALVTHMWAMISSFDERKERKGKEPEVVDEATRIYFLFPSSEKAALFAERAMAMLTGDSASPLHAKSVGPFARVTSELCRNRLFVDDLRMAADVFGGQAVSKGRTSWKVH